MLNKSNILMFVLVGWCAIGAIESADAAEPPARDVTYAEVLKDPDNVDLNILYARTQIRQGRLDKAQTALERVLLNAPDLLPVRMLYAFVLFRLDNRAEAKAVFLSLLEGGLSKEDKIGVEKYLAKIEARNKRTHVTLTVGTGIQYDDNKNSATQGGKLLLSDNEIITDTNRKSDYAKLLTFSMEGRHDLGLQRAYEVYGRLSGFATDQSVRDEFDLFYGKVDVGGTLPLDIGKLDISANFSNFHVGAASYSQSRGLRLRWDMPRNGSIFAPYFEQNSNLQLYSSHDDTSVAPGQNGWSHDTRVGVIVNLAVDKRLDANISRVNKNANASHRDYHRYAVSAAYTQTFNGGIFAVAKATYNTDLYREADTFISGRRRHDKGLRLGATLGMPLGSVFTGNLLPEEAQDVVLTAGVGYFKSYSNIANFKYDNLNTKLMLNKKFPF